MRAIFSGPVPSSVKDLKKNQTCIIEEKLKILKKKQIFHIM